jgi:flavin-dependent dehydrogenase
VGRPITILGAGISGLTAGIALARSGCDVQVIDRAEGVGTRYSGDLQGLENWTSPQDILEMLGEMGIPINFEYEAFRECTHYDSHLRAYRLRSNRVGFYLVRRGPAADTLDSSLKAAAESAGVKFRFGVKASVAAPDIIATGPRTPHLVAMGVNFRTGLKSTALGILDSAIAPRGYAYLLASRGHGTLAIISVAGRANLREYLEKATQRFRQILTFDISDPVPFAGSGSRFVRIGSGVPRVGEAGGFQDAMWGFGIRMALQTGHLAARALSEGRDYWALTSETVVPFCRSTVVNRFFYNLLGNTGYRLLLHGLVHAKDPVAFTNRVYRESPLKRLLYPLASRSIAGR